MTFVARRHVTRLIKKNLEYNLKYTRGRKSMIKLAGKPILR